MGTSIHLITASNTGGSTSEQLTIVVNDKPPLSLAYSVETLILTRGVSMDSLFPQIEGGSPTKYSVSPPLPASLFLDVENGVISGVPNEPQGEAPYTIVASNSGGEVNTVINILVKDGVPSGIEYLKSNAIYTQGVAITPNEPLNAEGVQLWSVMPSLPQGLLLNPRSGTIDGVPSTTREKRTYTVTAINDAGSSDVLLEITVLPQAPASLTYNIIDPRYTKLQSITPNAPMHTGGTVDRYTSKPSLPVGLSLNPVTGIITGTPLTLTKSVNLIANGDFTNGELVDNGGQWQFSPATINSWEGGGVWGIAESNSVWDPIPSDLEGRYVFLRSNAFIRQNVGGFDKGNLLRLSFFASQHIPEDSNLGNESEIVNVGGERSAGLVITISDGIVDVEIWRGDITAGEGWMEYHSEFAAPFSPLSLIITASGVGTVVMRDISLIPAPVFTIEASNLGGSTSTPLIIYIIDTPPRNLIYSIPTVVYTRGVDAVPNSPGNEGGTVVSYSISPVLPRGLTISPTSGVIRGTPESVAKEATYEVTARNSGGETKFDLVITVIDKPPLSLSYPASPAKVQTLEPITPLVPTLSKDGGVVVRYETMPMLPDGLAIDPITGIISGTPLLPSDTSEYAVVGTNSGGEVSFLLSLTVVAHKPTDLSYDSPTSHTVLEPITPLVPQLEVGVSDHFTVSPTLPGGLSIDRITGIISGTPRFLSKMSIYTVTASNEGGQSDFPLQIAIVRPAPLSITYGADSIFTLIKNIKIPPLTPTTTGGEVQRFSVSPFLPIGLELSSTTGVISGTPLLVSPTQSYTVSAKNDGGNTSIVLTFTVNDIAPVSMSYLFSFSDYVVNEVIRPNGPVYGGGTITSFAISPDLPLGLTMDNTSGVIEGTPRELSGSTVYTITGSNSGGSTTATIMIQVGEKPPTSLSYASMNTSYVIDQTIDTNTASWQGNVTSFTCTPALPAGLNIDPTTGDIFGTPEGPPIPYTSYIVQASNNGGSAEAVLSIQVTDVPPSSLVYTPSSVSASITDTLEMVPTVEGTVVIEKYTVSPPLPEGIELNTVSGVIKGTVLSLSDSIEFVVTASNTGGSAKTIISLNITDIAPLNILYPSDPTVAFVDVAMSSIPEYTGGPLTAAFASPSLPKGLSITTPTGAIEGVPLLETPMTMYTIELKNSGGSSFTQLSLAVTKEPPSNLRYGRSKMEEIELVAILPNQPRSDGGKISTFVVTPALPEGVTLDPRSGVIGGKAVAVSPMKSYTITASNSGGESSTTISLKVVHDRPTILIYDTPVAVYEIFTEIDPPNRPDTFGKVITEFSILPSLPLGMELDSTTGEIRGTPMELKGRTAYRVTGVNTGGTVNTVLNISVVNVEAPRFVYPTKAVSLVVGQPLQPPLTPVLAGSRVRLVFSVSPPLPENLILDSESGIISGTPTKFAPTKDYIITATNPGGSDSFTLTIAITEVPPHLKFDDDPLVFFVGVPTIRTPTVSEGSISFASVTPDLPPGLKVTNTGSIIGTATQKLSAGIIYTMTAGNTGGEGTTSFSISVVFEPPSLLTYPLTGAVWWKKPFPRENQLSSVLMFNDNDLRTCHHQSDSLLSTIQMASVNATACENECKTKYPTCRYYRVNNVDFTCNLLRSCEPGKRVSTDPPGTIYALGMAPSYEGGVATMWSINPVIAAGLSFDTITGVISGIPTELSTANTPTNYIIRASNSGGSTTYSLGLLVVMEPPLLVSFSPPPPFYIGVGVSVNIETINSGGEGQYSISPELPVGLTLSSDAGTITGTPQALTPERLYTLVASNTGGTSTIDFALSVVDAPPTDLR